MIARSLLALLLAAAAPARAQQGPAPVRRPRVALVLSGGGARGAAHVGVLKVLEELHIPVDIVVGTSMGSVVGGLYATGLSAQDLERFFRDFDWNAAFANAPPRGGLSFRRKEDDFDFLVGYGVGMRDFKFRFPLGVTQGQVFIGELRTVGKLTRSFESFDDLPIPFRCVATDLVSAQPVVISSGDLALAIRASAAVAPLFSPIWYQGRLLVDGGYLNNIPVNVARAMGADRVIVVDIGTPLQTKKAIDSIFDVFSQTSRIGGAEFDRRQVASLTARDLLIRPDLHDMSFVDFGKIPDAIRWGEQAALAQKGRLESFSLTESRYEAYRRSLKPRPPASVVVDRIVIESGANIETRIIRRMIRQEEGRPLDLRQLQADLLRVEGLGYFDYVDYHVSARDGENVLVVSAPRLSWGPGSWRFGLELDEDFRTVSIYQIGVQYTQMDMNRWGGEARAQAHVGTNSDFDLELFQPVFREPKFFHVWAPIFLDPRVSYTSQLVNLAIPGSNAVRYRALSPLAGFDAGYFVSNVAELRAGLERSWNSANLQFGKVAPGNATVYFNDADYFGRVTVDTLDHPSFPHRGVYWKGEWRDSAGALGSERQNVSFDSSGAGFTSWGRHTLAVKVIYSTNLDTRTSTPALFPLGGLLRLSGFPEDQLFGTDRILGQVRYYWNAATVARMPVYLGSALEWGGAWFGRQQIAYDTGYWAGTGFLGVDTPLGPLFLASSLASGDRFAETLFLGHSF